MDATLELFSKVDLSGIDVWGLTGIMGSGKSAALEYLRQKGFAVSDTDRLAREIWSASYPKHSELRDRFRREIGAAYLDDAGGLRRDELRAAVAVNAQLRVALEKTTHPHILNLLLLRVTEARNRGSKAFFVEGTRLVESGLIPVLKGLILVEIAPDTAFDRVRERTVARGLMSEEEARGLLSSQDQDKMKQAANIVWANNGDLTSLKEQIDGFIAQFSVGPA